MSERTQKQVQSQKHHFNLEDEYSHRALKKCCSNRIEALLSDKHCCQFSCRQPSAPCTYTFTLL